MDIKARLLALNPRLPDERLQLSIEGGERYAAQFDRLPAHDRTNIVFLFAAYALTDSTQYKVFIRRGIDDVLAPHYPGVK